VLLVVIYRNDELGHKRFGPYLGELGRGGQVQRLGLPRLDETETGAQHERRDLFDVSEEAP
jgi:hypothetical protein